MTTASIPAPIEPVIVDAQHDGATARVEMLVPRDLLYFRGHFPDYPVLPGIVQTHWAVACARRFFAIGGADVAGLQVKFKRIIAPEERLRLDLAFERARGRVSFAYRVAESVCSSGVITFAGA